jgi:tetratricopeptide (TPR) repeat protein
VVGQNQKAIDDYNAAIKLNPKQDETSYLARAGAYYDAKQYQKSVSDYDVAARLCDYDAQGFIGRALAYAKLNENDKAIADLQKAVQIQEPHL